MGRPKKYRRDEIVGRVKNAFWQHGYQALGIRGIEDETGLGRFAIRTEFGGKEGLMTAAMDAYSDDFEAYVHDHLSGRDGVDAITELLESMVMPHPNTMRHFGCLIVNTMVENAHVGSDAFRAAIERHFGKLKEEVHALVLRGRAASTIDHNVDPAAAAAFLEGSIMAIMLMNRAAGDASGGAHFAKTAIETVQGWGVKNS